MSQNESSWVVDVTESDFETQVLQQSRDRPVVVDFWAPWCGPCRMLGPLLEKVVGERDGAVLLAKINTDVNQRLAAQFQITSIPMVIAFRDGRAVAEFVGLLPEEQLRQFLNQIMPGEADKLARQAAGLEESDPVGAEGLYRQALEKDQRLDGALLGLARVLIAQNKDAEAVRLLEDADVSSDLAEEVDRLKGQLAIREIARTFGAEPAARRRLEADPKNAQVYYELGCVLAAQGKYPEALESLLAAGERDPALAAAKVRAIMVQIFHVVGDHSTLANEYRQRLTALLY